MSDAQEKLVSELLLQQKRTNELLDALLNDRNLDYSQELQALREQSERLAGLVNLHSLAMKRAVQIASTF